jgi:hypothetical protein
MQMVELSGIPPATELSSLLKVIPIQKCKSSGFLLRLAESAIQVPAALAAFSSTGLMPYAPKWPNVT